jgi:hypothetical protein
MRTCWIDYKMDSGMPKLLEINPRFGATLTRDINRYLEAYLSSLGMMTKSLLPRINSTRARSCGCDWITSPAARFQKNSREVSHFSFCGGFIGAAYLSRADHVFPFGAKRSPGFERENPAWSQLICPLPIQRRRARQ